jgi:adenylyltransferase/sulfurtransferase
MPGARVDAADASGALDAAHAAQTATSALKSVKSLAVEVPRISVRELADLLAGDDPERSVLLVDVRGSEERSIASIPGARAIHLDEFRSGTAVSQIPFDQPVVIHCRSGVRSEEASRILIEAGHPDVRHLEGGVLAWVREIDPAQPSY